jgi:hypothetical protein
MSDELIINKPSELIETSKYATPNAVAEMQSGSGFLPYIQLMGSSSNIVKQGKFPVGHFSLVKGKEHIDLGDTFDAIVLGMRPRAIDFSDFLSVFNPENPEFQRIKDSTGQGFAWGMEYLLYMQDFDEMACYLFGNPSHRNETPNVIAIFEEQREKNDYILTQFESYLLPPNKKGHSWHVPQVTKSESAITKMVGIEKLQPIREKFNNPVETEVETVEEDSRDI